MPGSPRRREVFSGVLGWQEIGLDGGLCEGRKRLAKSTDTPLFMSCVVFPSHSCVEVLVAGPLERSWIWREVIKVKQSHLSGSCSNATRVLVRRGPETRLCEDAAGRQLSASQRERPREKPVYTALLAIPCSGTSRRHICRVYATRGLCYLVMAALADRYEPKCPR